MMVDGEPVLAALDVGEAVARGQALGLSVPDIGKRVIAGIHRSDAQGPVRSPVIIVRVHPDVRRGLPFFGEPDHMHRRRVTRRPA
jgi:hypothetical protein